MKIDVDSNRPGEGTTPSLTVCIFAKEFVAGQVKTRLMPVAGAEGALELALAMFQDTMQLARTLQWARVVVASTGPLAESLLPTGCELWSQGEGDLGKKLERILRRALEQSAAAIAVGSDSPGLPAEYLEHARTALESADAVLGPSRDGGFYLIGLRRCPPGLLDGIGWSCSDTLAATLEKLTQAGMKTAGIEPWFDVDEPQDLDHLRQALASGSIVAPNTSLALARLYPQAPQTAALSSE